VDYPQIRGQGGGGGSSARSPQDVSRESNSKDVKDRILNLFLLDRAWIKTNIINKT